MLHRLIVLFLTRDAGHHDATQKVGGHLMKLVKSLLLGSATGLMSIAGAYAADLPVAKAAPVEYVRVCSTYGAGFFYIPGTDTCLRVSGRVRADYLFNSPEAKVLAGTTAAGVPA